MDIFIVSYGNAKEWYFNFVLKTTPIVSSIIEFSNPNYKSPGLTLAWWEDIVGKEVFQTRTAVLKIPILKPEISYTPTSSENPF